MYDKGSKRSFSKHEQKKLFTWAFFCCFVMMFSFCALFISYSSPLLHLNSQLVGNLNLNESCIIDTINDQRDDREVIFRTRNDYEVPPGRPFNKVGGVLVILSLTWLMCWASAYFNPYVKSLTVEKTVHQNQMKTVKPTPAAFCNFSFPRSDFCEINGDSRIHGNSSTIYISPSLLRNTEGGNNITWKLRPYARKIDRNIMRRVRELALGSPFSFGINEMPHCSTNHSIPAIVFSTVGYTGNHFHSFTDVLVPLFITSKHLNGEVQFLITNFKPGWIIKYKALLDSLSKYPIIDIDNSKKVHCFQGMIVGLKNHKEFSIDPSKTPQGYSMKNFTQFVRKAYSLRRSEVKPLRAGDIRKPRLLIISRKRSRAILNIDELAAEAKRIGYKVEIMEASKNLQHYSKKVNSFDVMVGVHGAGLTNSVFLPEKAVLIQIVPIGLDWLSKHDFELPAISMNLRYLEYKIGGKESSLADEYPLEHPMMRKPSTKQHGWSGYKKVYLDGQNVKIDMSRFRDTLSKSLELLQQ